LSYLKGTGNCFPSSLVNRYPILLLVVELFGYSAMLPYAWMLVRRSRVKPLTPAQLRAMQGRADGGSLPFDPPPTTFHVMVPTYLVSSGSGAPGSFSTYTQDTTLFFQ
jgi:hypothetical protein